MFQRYATRSLALERTGFEARLEHCRRHLQNYADLRPERPLPASALENGSSGFSSCAQLAIIPLTSSRALAFTRWPGTHDGPDYRTALLT